MSLSVGLILKLQGPEMLWQLRRKTKPGSLLGAFISASSIVVIAIVAGGLSSGIFLEDMKIPPRVQCPQPSVVWK